MQKLSAMDFVWLFRQKKILKVVVSIHFTPRHSGFLKGYKKELRGSLDDGHLKVVKF